jgi:type II secretory pathway component PulK
MKIHRRPALAGHRAREGAALLLSLMILLVLIAIVIQINVSTGTDARVARNDVGLTGMDLATESALLQVYDKLKADAENTTSGDAGSPAPGGTSPTGTDAQAQSGAGAAAGGAGGAGAQQQPSDSRRDEWATPQRTEINEIKLRIVVQDEDSKYNVLNMMNPDPTQAQAAFDRVVRILDLCREGTAADIDPGTATQMAKAMLEYMQRRKLAKFPKPKLLSDSDDQNLEDQGLPLSLKEFAVLQPFDESHFRDFQDENEKVVHSIGSFLTVWTSIGLNSDKPSATATGATAAAGNSGAKNGTSGSSNSGSKPTSGSTSGSSGSSAQSSLTVTSGSSPGGPSSSSSGASGSSGGGGNGAQAGAGAGQGTPGGNGTKSTTGGFGVNVNTAPPAVLKALFDDRELHPRFWDKVIEYRNLEDEEEKKKKQESASTTEEQPALDEYGNPIIKRNIFDSLAKLSEVDGYKDLEPAVTAKLNQLLTTQSNVFSIYVIARRSTSVEGDMTENLTTAKERRQAEQRGDALVRYVRSVVWRHKKDDKVEIVPIVRWEVIDYEPWEVLDFPDEDR